MPVTYIASETFPQKGVRTIPVTFTDEAGNLVIPNSVFWTLTNRPSDWEETPVIVNSKELVEVTDLASIINITLEGNDLDFIAGETGSLVNRVLSVSYQYDSDLGDGLDDKIQYLFTVERMYGV